MGYRKVSAAEQIFYIIKYAAKEKARRLRDRFRLWRKPKKGCRRCCLWCKYFEHCRSEMEEADNE